MKIGANFESTSHSLSVSIIPKFCQIYHGLSVSSMPLVDLQLCYRSSLSDVINFNEIRISSFDKKRMVVDKFVTV